MMDLIVWMAVIYFVGARDVRCLKTRFVYLSQRAALSLRLELCVGYEGVFDRTVKIK